MSIPRRTAFPLLLLSLVFSTGILQAHPVPDLPVRSHFHRDGNVEVRVEVDPRSFTRNPAEHDYMVKSAVDALPPEELPKLSEKANRFVASRLKFHFEPLGEVIPVFTWEFQKLGDEGPLEKADDSSVLVGSWKTTLPGGLSGYRLQSLKLSDPDAIPMNVVFLNFFNDEQVERYAVLFPGETSFLLDLTGLAAPTPALTTSHDAVQVHAASADWWAVFRSEIKRGFLHVIPLGWDHVLFVLGLFLMSRKWKPLLFQVSTFTLAHTLTLWIASAGWVSISPKVIEPVIAFSIVAVALENLIRREYSHWRLLIVFVFGLIHGLGFAGVMSTRLDSTTSLVVGLLGINIGVELGQLAIITIAFVATFWITSAENYRKFVVVPGSILIALAGIFWVVERTLL
ncbi:MAG: HupE/UreJ family protein [Verrucomicrobiales bacterium]|jgi:hypothetical protein|nr:HupE/UreJ family protein [Verrucomicrobiales bacterium]MBP9222312.1 HupE/UreJ family protein [Verrucomicrobiales bacterium]